MGLPHGCSALAESWQKVPSEQDCGCWQFGNAKSRGGSRLRADAKVREMGEQEDGVGHGTLQAQKNPPCFRRRGWKTGSRNSSIDFFSQWPDSVSANVKLSSDLIWLLKGKKEMSLIQDALLLPASV